MLSYLASICNPVGLILPSHVIGSYMLWAVWREKALGCRNFCRTEKTSKENWKLVSDINSVKIELLRSLPLAQGSITAINIYVFVDAIIVADYAAGYAVIMYQANSVSQGLVTSKSRISKLLQFPDSN